jgi:PPM family protein phosphatase
MSDLVISPAIPLRAAYSTDPGRVRSNNEDLPVVDPIRGVYGVIDGIGGQAAGEVAAAIAAEVILQRLARPLGTPAERVREAIAIANNEIFRQADESPELHGMACVVTIALVTDHGLTIGHVGDARLYLMRGGRMQKLTHDHSPVGEREDALEMSEADAMRHPRRNEVFRDVGSGYHDKDDEEFVELIEAPFSSDSAMLLCTDGLTDMLPSTLIERIVRQHAGQPQQVVDALVAAANEAGGKDNVTVVYAEAPGFADEWRRPWNAVASAPESAPPVPDSERRRPGLVLRLARSFFRSRSAWFGIGTAAGIAAALAVVWRLGVLTLDGSRTLIVGGAPASAFLRITEAVRAAQSGDVIRVEPGIYRERIDLPDGVDLVARIPGSVTVARPPGTVGDAIGLTAHGESPARIQGIRVESTPEMPLDAGIRISGQGRTLEMIEVSGPMRAGLEVLPASAVTVIAGHFEVTGPAVTFGEGTRGNIVRSVFLRRGGNADPAIAASSTADIGLRRNVFSGYGAEFIKGMAGDALRQLKTNNAIVSEGGGRGGS